MKKKIKYLYKLIPFKKEIFCILKLIYKPSPEIYKHLYFWNVFKVKVKVKVKDKTFKMKHYGYQIENEIFWEGLENGWEKTSMSLWMNEPTTMWIEL